MQKSYTIFSDGGSDGRGGSGSATIIDLGLRRRLQIVCDLGKATNNEAEIFSGIVGFFLLSKLPETKESFLNSQIHWISDSQYALKSASQYISNWVRNGWKTAAREPVKNQGLWKLFLGITSNIEFTTEHVKGHAGHIENELCDQAVGWVREGGSNIEREGWVVIDGREIIEELRLLDAIPDRLQIDEIMGVVLNNILGEGEPKNKTSIQDSSKGIKNSQLSLVAESTDKYFQDLKKIEGIKEYINENPDLKKILTGLKTWLKRNL